MINPMTGPLAVFDSSMTGACTRKATAIEIIEAATFASLEMEFPAEGENSAAFTDVTYPPLFRLLNVKSFQVASGSVLVAFRA